MTWQRDESDAIGATRAQMRTGARSRAANAAPKHNGAHSRVNGTAQRRDTAAPMRPTRNSPQHSLVNHDQPNREHEGYLIKELQHLLRSQIEARMRARGLWLSFPHSAVLMTLNAEPGLSGAQLARRCSVTAQTMNGLLMPLEKKGLIERRPDPENARVLRCFLKAKGNEIMEQGMYEASAVFKLMLGALSSREREEFRSILRRCVQALHENAEQMSHGGHVDAQPSKVSKTKVSAPNAAVRMKRKPKK